MRSTPKRVSNQWLQTLRFLQRCSFMSQTGSALDWDEKKSTQRSPVLSNKPVFSKISLSFSLSLAQTFPWLPHFLPLQSATRNHLKELGWYDSFSSKSFLCKPIYAMKKKMLKCKNFFFYLRTFIPQFCIFFSFFESCLCKLSPMETCLRHVEKI